MSWFRLAVLPYITILWLYGVAWLYVDKEDRVRVYIYILMAYIYILMASILSSQQKYTHYKGYNVLALIHPKPK